MPRDANRNPNPPSRGAAGSAVGGDFYNGIEWFACWLLDNSEGATIDESQLRGWAIEAWRAHLEKQNAGIERPCGRKENT